MNLTEIIFAPYITEKTHLMKTSSSPKLSFIVNVKSNKIEIKKAFYAIFNVKPISVNTLIRKPKPTKFIAKSRVNYSKKFKIAHISLRPEDFDMIKNSLEENKPQQ